MKVILSKTAVGRPRIPPPDKYAALNAEKNRYPITYPWVQQWTMTHNMRMEDLIVIANKMSLEFMLVPIGRNEKRSREWMSCWLCRNFQYFIQFIGRPSTVANPPNTIAAPVMTPHSETTEAP